MCEQPSEQLRTRRPNPGQFKLGNTKSVKYGLRSKRAADALLPGQEQVREALASRLAGLVADQGGETAIGVVKADALATYQRLWVLEETLWRSIETEGALTAKGRARAAMDAFLRVVDRRVRLGAELGLERKTRRVDLARQLAETDHR